jgi:membrane-associated protein
MPVDIEALIKAVGYPGLFLIVFAETGLLIGFFLPGDTLLITCGLLAQRGYLEIWLLIPLLIVAAVVGDATGYQIGKHTGPRIFKREDSRWFHRRHLERAQEFYDRHGGKTIVIARFLALIRTFAPTVAGAAQMPYRRFAMFNIVGASLWVPSMIVMGHVAGQAVPNLDIFFVGLVGLMLVVSLVPGGWHLLRERRAATRRRDSEAAAPETVR